ncbi:threonine dehydratase catabolic [Lophiotrema nucula]|uniref:Threonine dehydratase catabolic n=1 Tax=Lophiotrema nucula TaxID=690887 RepID=A0A6A5ZU08_9PLEO|nr:threonine dehydratase catabolic [Lophiotrema nucula]
MASNSEHTSLTRTSVIEAHELIKEYIHYTPVHTSKTLDELASTPRSSEDLASTEWKGQEAAKPKINLFFKCENYQKIGAFKARGAFHAVSRLTPEEKSKGIMAHSSGNHAQAVALVAKTFGIPVHIVMPSIAAPSKIAGTKSLGAKVVISGPSLPEREAAIAELLEENPGATVIPPYDHPHIILGQGTASLELEDQVKKLDTDLDAIITPLGGGGLLAGTATAMHGTGIRVFGSEPRFQGANDGERGLKQRARISSVSTLTIADGLRTPVGILNWTVISDSSKLKGIYSVTEEQIKKAMKLVLERMKIFVEPSACVPLAVVLYNEDFRKMVETQAGDKGWNIGVIFSGGNTTVDAIAKLFTDPKFIPDRV